MAWRKIDKKLFKEIPETYYLATPFLASIRHERNWSLRHMAEKAGVSVTYYHDFERGRVRASKEFIEKIRIAIGSI